MYLAGIGAHSAYLIGCDQKLFFLEVVPKHSTWSMLHDQVDRIVEEVWIRFKTYSNQPMHGVVHVHVCYATYHTK